MTEAVRVRHINTEPPIPTHCRYLLYDPILFPWSRIGQTVMDIERENFKEKAETEEKFVGIFADPASVIGLITDTSLDDQVVGMSVVIPAVTEYSFPDWQFPERLHESPVDLRRVRYVHVTQLRKTHQGKKLVGGLNRLVLGKVMETDALHLERDAATEEGYATKLVAAYAHLIEESYVHPSKFGEQMFIRQRLRAIGMVQAPINGAPYTP